MSRHPARPIAPPDGSPGVRAATESDLGALVSLWTEITAHHRGLDPLFTLRGDAAGAIRALLRGMLADPCSAIFVVPRDGEVVGMGCVRIDRAPPILQEVARAEVTDLGVRRSFRRQGLGSALAEAALAWVRERGIARMEVRVVVGNPEGQAFWRALGFGEHVEVLQRSV